MAEKMKVAFIVGVFPTTTETFILNQVTGLLDKGIDLRIISLHKPVNQQIPKEIKKYNLEKITDYVNTPRNKKERFFKGIYIFARNFFKHPLKTVKAINFMKYGKVAISLQPLYLLDYFMNNREEYDILHCHFGQRGIYGALLKEAGIKGKLITSFYGGDLTAFVDKTSSNIYNPLFKKADLLLPLCNDFKKRLINLGANEKITITHHIGIENRRFNLKRDLGHKKEIIILTIARFVEKKGHKYLIEALGKLANKNEKIICRLIGDGELKKIIEKKVRDDNLTKIVKFDQSVNPDELSKIYNGADIFVLPSVTSSNGDTEGTPASIIEAQASGLPVVSTYHAGIPEIILDNKSGFLVNEKDSDALADKIDLLIMNASLRRKMGETGRNYMAKEYNQDIQTNRLISLYKKLLA